MALELHNLPPWSEDSRKAVLQQLQLEVGNTLSTKPDIRPPVMQFHTIIGVPEPIYEELSISKSEIRLLDLALTEDDSCINCSLVRVSLNSAPEYAALSYEWGDAANIEEILVNGHPFQARSNLIAALRQFRKIVRSSSNHDSSKAIRLWVDAVCINQNDITERNSQVQLMRSIYMNAKIVLSWIGMEEYTELAITALRGVVDNLELSERIDKDTSLLPSQYPCTLRDVMWLGGMRSLFKSQYFVIRLDNVNSRRTTGNYIWDVLTRFANHSYWHRVWIVQEVILGREVLLVARDEAIRLDSLDIFTQQLRDLLLHPRPCPPIVDPQIWSIISTNFHAWKILRQTTDMRWQHQHGMLKGRGLDLVLATRTHRATDPRDSIFGLLGVTEMGIVADYSRSTESVYCEFASRWIAEGKALESLLNFAGCGIHASQPLDLPSWIPNLQLLGTFSNFDPSSYNAGGDQRYFSLLSFLVGPFVSKDNILRTCGAIVSTVTSTSPIMGDLGQLEEGYKRHFEFGTAYLASKTALMYPTGIPFLQAFFRVALRDQDCLQDKKPLLSTSPTFFSLALGFLRALIHTTHFAMGEDLEKTLAICLPPLGLSPGSDFAPSFCKNFLSGLSTYVDSWTSAEDAISSSDNLNGLITAMLVLSVENSDKRFFETSDGLLGLGPRGMEETDFVAVLSGFKMPVILREVDSHYQFVGSCFVLGLMNGEAQQWGPSGKLDAFEMLEIH
jgi:hypothetical protein